jgi:hypothetical protein
MNFFSSWKSKLGGVLIAIGPLIQHSAPPQWSWVGDACLTLGGILLAGGRDNSVSSETAGAK